MMIAFNCAFIVLQAISVFIGNLWLFCVLRFIVGALSCTLLNIRTILVRKMAPVGQS